MKITHCKLKKSIQKKLLQFFVLEVTARSAADLSGIHPNSAVLFYRKIREVIIFHWKPIRFLTAQLSWTKATLADTAKANVDAVRQTRWQFLVFSNAAARFIPWLLRTLKERRYFLLSQRKLCLTVLSIRIV